MLMLLVSVLVTPDLAFSLSEVSNMILAFAAFFVVAREARRPNGFAGFLALFLAAGLTIAVFSLINTTWSTKIGFLASLTAHFPPRLVGSIGIGQPFNPNQMAGSLLWVAPMFLCLPIGLATMAHARPGAPVSRFAHLARLGLIALLLLTALPVLADLLLTQSRGAYIAFALVLPVLLFLALPRRGRWIMALTLLVATIAAAIFLWQRRDTIAPQLGLSLDPATASAPAPGADSTAQGLDTLNGRMEIWSRALYGIEDFPFTGMGMNSFRRVVHLLYPLFLTSPDSDIAHAHNEFLQAALDLGLPGMIAFGALYLVAAWMLRRIWLAADTLTHSPPLGYSPPLTRALTLGLGGGLFAHFIFGLTDAVALGALPGVLFWMLLGLITGLFTLTRSPSA